MSRRSKSRDEQPKPLYETIRTFRGAIPPERLFEAAGYDRDSTEEIEAFYVALRDELGRRIREQKTQAGIRLEVIPDAVG